MKFENLFEDYTYNISNAIEIIIISAVLSFFLGWEIFYLIKFTFIL